MTEPFRLPPYPYDELDRLREVAAASADSVDCSIGTPCDPVPEVAIAAASAAVREANGYPSSVGSPGLRDAAAAWLARTFDVVPEALGVCVGTKELVVSLPRALRLRSPDRDTVLFPAVSYPSYAMGATLAGCRGVPVPLDDDWHLDLDAVDPLDAQRSLLVWVNEPGNPTASAVDAPWFARAAAWARDRGVILASDECYAPFAARPATALAAGQQGVLALHSVSKRSNLAGARVGFYSGDPELVAFLGELRKHAGLMVSTPMQAVAAAVLSDDDHATQQAAEYAARKEMLEDGLAAYGIGHVGGPTPFYLWLAAEGMSGVELAERFARAGTVVAPGGLYGPDGAGCVRLALVQPRERLARVIDRLAKEPQWEPT